jgi:hypothetical protein
VLKIALRNGFSASALNGDQAPCADGPIGINRHLCATWDHWRMPSKAVPDERLMIMDT